MNQPDSLADAAIFIVEKELGKPYVWGGDNPLVGFDCSGLMVEACKAVGRLPRQGDWTARDLAVRFPPTAKLRRGDLVFWNRGSEIGHVEMIWAVYGRLVLTIGASGGGSTTTSREEAIQQDAYVRIRPITPGWVSAVSPFNGS
jgi:hypothetical protein